MTSTQLLIEAEASGISVSFCPLPRSGSCSASISGDCFIGIDIRRQSEAVDRVRIAHELGHCMTGAFYEIEAPVASRRKCERIADEYAIRKLIPEDELREAIKKGDTEPWQLAERFDVPCEFMEKALRFYFEV